MDNIASVIFFSGHGPDQVFGRVFEAFWSEI